MRKKQIPINFSIRISIAMIALLLIALAALPVASALGVVTSCNSTGYEINQFAPNESVYVRGEDFLTNRKYNIWIQNESVLEGDTLVSGEDPSGAQEQVSTDKTIGNFGPTLIWSIPSDAPITFDEYDIVVDLAAGGGTYNTANDGLDSADVAGMIAPVPDASSLILFTSGLVLVSVYFVYGSRREKWKEEL